MNNHRNRLLVHTIGSVVLIGSLTTLETDSHADSVAQVQTAKRIAESTVALIDPESGTSTGGSTTDVNYAVGDVLTFTIQFTPVPNGSVRGAAGYITEYIPPNTEVVGARIIDRDGNTVVPHRGGIAPNGWGSRGSMDYSTFGLQQGSLAQVYADTGIFYSTDGRTARIPANELITVFNGLEMDPDPSGTSQLDDLLGIPSNGPYYAHNRWDWVQSMGFGSSGEHGPPLGGDINDEGRGNTPHLYGSAVAGPQTHYPYEATQTGAETVVANGTVGPWQRIKYVGSETGSGVFSPNQGVADRVGVPITTGWDLSVDNPLPAGTNAVRFAVGELVVGDEYFAEISLRVLASPLDPLLGDANCAEVFGGDASSRTATIAGKDNTWRYFLPSPACVLLNLFFELDVDKILAVPGEQLTYTISGKNLSTNPQTNVVITDEFDPAILTFISANPPPDSVVGGLITWPTIPTLAPGEEIEYTVTVLIDNVGDDSTLNRTRYVSTELPGGFSTVALTNLGERAFIRLGLTASPDQVAPGDTFTYTGTIHNSGNGFARGDEYIVQLPTGFTIVPGTSYINGDLKSDPDGGPSEYSYTQGEEDAPAGATNTLTFDVQVAPSVITGLYTSCLETWHGDTGFGRNINDAQCFIGPVAVGAVRSDTPDLNAPISLGSTCVSGTTTEADGSTVEVFFNGQPQGTVISTGGAFLLCGLPAVFGGQHITATVTAVGELESLPSAPVIVSLIPACNDGADNDLDGVFDFPADIGCDGPADTDEADPPLPECSDGSDNNMSMQTDWPDDPSCSSPLDNTEDGQPACSDNVDNDFDGLIDFDGGGVGAADPDCADANDATEADFAACQDGLDNDTDGLRDFPDDPGCFSAFDDDEVDDVSTSANAPARLLIVFDTSGSMNFHTCADEFTGGDGSLDCSGSDVSCAVCPSVGCGNGIADDSRLHKVKAGISNTVAAFGEVEWGLMRFHQRGDDFSCPTEQASLNSGGWQGGGAAPCGGGFDAGDLVVSFSPENANALIAYMDGSTNYAGSQPPIGFDQELRGSGTTPLAGALGSALTYLSGVQAVDPKVSCRPYQVILVTDGQETCGGDPSATAASLLAANIPVSVIGFSTNDSEIISGLDSIAASGGTGNAIVVDDESTLSSAIAAIVSSTILVEVCNELDDDCDGSIDEDFLDKGDACTDGALGLCTGNGNNVCNMAGDGTVCDITNPGLPADIEVCNVVDDDCDGSIDEGVGPCTCAPEICNNLDDDCDGTVDEQPLVGEGDACGIAIGQCVQGTLTCLSGAFECIGTTDPGTEVCNNLDDDCDSFTDEVATECYTFGAGCTVGMGCEGICRTGLQGCVGGADGPCVGEVGPSMELCNGLDDDCDGAVDEAFTNLGMACDNGQLGLCNATGVFACLPDGSDTFCTAPMITPGTESCNGVDDDCDMNVDEQLGAPVGNSCGGTTSCTLGTLACNAGVLECQGSVGGTSEVCNGVDDDCDMVVDEEPLAETGATCTDPGFEALGDTGECAFGTTACVGGSVVCQGYVGPQAESCDNLDNDCDGELDNQATCSGPDEVCVEGACIFPCAPGEFPCPFCYYCTDVADLPDRYCVSNPCCDVVCADGETCNPSDGQCIDPCEDVTCGDGEICQDGLCGHCLLPGFDCADDEICQEDEMTGMGACVPDPCEGVMCDAGQFCNNGVCDCVVCDPMCGDGQVCVDCECEADPCANVQCPNGQICRPSDGMCILDDLCDDITCQGTEVCDPGTGQCTQDLCVGVTCPDEYECELGLDGLPNCVIKGDAITVGGSGCGCDADGRGAPPVGGGLLMILVGVLLYRRTRREGGR